MNLKQTPRPAGTESLTVATVLGVLVALAAPQKEWISMQGKDGQ